VAQVIAHQINNFKKLISSLNAPSYFETTPKLAALLRAEFFCNDKRIPWYSNMLTKIVLGLKQHPLPNVVSTRGFALSFILLQLTGSSQRTTHKKEEVLTTTHCLQNLLIVIEFIFNANHFGSMDR